MRKNKPIDERQRAINEYWMRRDLRLQARFDANPRLAYGIAKGMGIKTEGMTPQEVWEAIRKKGGGKSSIGKSGKPNEAAAGSLKKKGTAEKPGEVRTGKSGNMRPKSDGAKRIDTADALYETKLYKESGGKKGLAKNSLSDYIEENGNLKPERQAVHDQIVKSFFADKVPQKGQATMIMSGGGPASGKSFIEKGARSKFGDETTVTIDPDKVKAMLPGYEEMAAKDEGAAGFYHEESSALAKRLYQYAADNNINVVYDGTGDGSVNSVRKKLKTAQDAGYAIKGSYVTVDTEEAIKRNRARYEHMKAKYEAGESKVPPRLPKEQHVKSIHAAVSDISIQVAGMFDDFELWDNNVPKGSPRVLIAKCRKGGGLMAVAGQEERLQRYLNKGTSGAKVVGGRVVMP